MEFGELDKSQFTTTGSEQDPKEIRDMVEEVRIEDELNTAEAHESVKEHPGTLELLRYYVNNFENQRN